MKAVLTAILAATSSVAPLVGAWIESRKNQSGIILQSVAPLVGAWIESERQSDVMTFILVAPLVGAWIERNPLSAIICG